MPSVKCILQAAVIAAVCSCVLSWNQDEMDMYDLIEEIGMKPNFYELLGLAENATSMEVRRTFRQLSLIHHPDKSDAEDAEVKFRQLVGVYEVLRDTARREMYDKFLVDGMPDWRSALYYYRRARKMGMLEITIILSIITTIGQYLTSWAGYKERRLAVEDAVRSKFKRERKMGKDIDFDAMIEKNMEEFEKPSWWNTLPFQLVRGVRWLVCRAPFALVESVRAERERREQERLAAERAREEEEQQREEAQRQRDKRREMKERRRQRLQELPEGGPEAAAAPAGAAADAGSGRTWSTARSGPWADEDLVELARLVKRHPGGTPERWELIAEALERTVAEVTRMARQIRDRPHMVPVSAGAQTATADGRHVADSVLEPAAPPPPPPPRKVKTRGAPAAAAGADEAAWSQQQQRALETALAQYPKGSAERWERIAKAVPDKTKEECMLRFRYLAEMVKKRKEADSQKEEADSQPDEAEPQPEGPAAETIETVGVSSTARCAEPVAALAE
ncbi:dnaJ homolog subfamily C member 1-like [Pollicipes pollicipes]|uniref:dnaJ homolog subfamily C member 1-like n=1 Tax=Pollicipes pollicipes TaxID=41117 RepID=UPI0018851823|nr:dnaJ homolog subfamily C member 1-like [Pollicipes pollicipes]XP_037089935.1 dnaJ homolog subfamily C member 1-like [Pollicipes pollicipes]XP_037089936.1 dnaJ homolog subfamily C member 1-like [Pollicipes pollicipes]